MSKKKSERMETLKKLAEWREQEAAQALSQHQLKVQSEQLQLDDLKRYYNDYLSTIDEQKSLERQELINYRSFCQQLAQTIKQGEKRVDLLSQEQDRFKQSWILLRNKRRVLEELISRCIKEESQWLDGELEKEMEDMMNSNLRYRAR